MAKRHPDVQLSRLWSPFFSFVILQIFLVQAVVGFELLLMHTNDFHDRIQETNKYSGSCSASDSQDGKCFGGSARIKKKVDELRAQHPNSLLLSAGDQFQGTLWYYHFGGTILATFMNLIGYDAMALGNHEFDNGVEGLAPFLKNATFPVLSSNLDLSDVPSLQGMVAKSINITVDGQTFGIIGYTTTQTTAISNPGAAKFKDELTSIQAEADKLMAAGINKIIAVGHIGYMNDLDLARRLRGVDVIVGGHSNTFLYNGAAPSNNDPMGAYPTVVTSDVTGEQVLVVQDYAYGKYLGQLYLTFDDDGKVTNYRGNPILLDSSVSKDKDAEDLVNYYLPQVLALQAQEIGYSHVFLDGDSTTCRVRECNMGNLITDAMLKQNIRHADSVFWSDVSIAIQNSGGIRSSISKGVIHIGDAIKVQPFRNSVDIVELRGESILTILEHGASLWQNGTDLYGGFLQVSGLRIVYNMSQPAGSRVVDVQVRCAKCEVPQFGPLNMSEVYQVLMNTFLADGGDKYYMIPQETVQRHVIGNVDLDLFVQYVKNSGEVTTGLEGRIRFIQEIQEDPLIKKLTESSSSHCVGDSASFMTGSPVVIMLTLLSIALLLKYAH